MSTHRRAITRRASADLSVEQKNSSREHSTPTSLTTSPYHYLSLPAPILTSQLLSPHGSKSSFPPHGSRRCTGDSKLYVSPNIPFPVSVLSISLLHNPLPLQDLHTEVSQCFRPTNLDDQRMTAHICVFHRRDDFPSLPSLSYVSR